MDSHGSAIRCVAVGSMEVLADDECLLQTGDIAGQHFLRNDEFSTNNGPLDPAGNGKGHDFCSLRWFKCVFLGFS